MSARNSRTAPLGSAILGQPEEPVRRLRIRVQSLLTLSLAGTHIIGALIAATLINVVIPGPSLLTSEFLIVIAVLAPAYVVVAIVVGTILGTRYGVDRLGWALDGRRPTPREQRTALNLPLRMTMQQGLLWIIGLVLFTTCLGIIDPDTIPKVSITILLAGLTVCGFVYLFTEFALRPIAARALEAGAPRRHRFAGTTGRVMLAWALGSSIPVIGLMLIAVFSFIRPVTPVRFAVTILALGSITLLVGSLLLFLSVRSSIATIESVQYGMSQIEKGDLDTKVVVYDGTELGELQAGFNRMAEGLRERERIREVFGRHVGRDVAAEALDSAGILGGEERCCSSTSSGLRPSRPRDLPSRSSLCSTVSSRWWSTRSTTPAGRSTSSRATRRWRSSVLRSGSTTRPVVPCGPHARWHSGSRSRSPSVAPESGSPRAARWQEISAPQNVSSTPSSEIR